MELVQNRYVSEILVLSVSKHGYRQLEFSVMALIVGAKKYTLFKVSILICAIL